MKQEALAEAVGVAGLSISHYENGRQAPRIEVLERIAAATGKPLAWFFQDEDAAPVPAAQPPPPPDTQSLLAQLVAAQVRQALSLSGALALDEGAEELCPALSSQPGRQFRAQAEAENLGLAPASVGACRAGASWFV